MKAKLIKDKHIDNFYYLKIGINTYATTGKESFRVLSLKNCQAIERDCDLDEYAEAIGYASEYGHSSPEGFSDEQIGRLHGFIDGFQKALELLGDKKFSEEGMMNFGEYVWKHGGRERSMNQLLDDYKASQQNEFDVEVVMENVYSVNNGETEMMPKLKTKLDADGCIILKRV